MSVFPAGAGVIPTAPGATVILMCVSRRRGGDPSFMSAGAKLAQCFPQARG